MADANTFRLDKTPDPKLWDRADESQRKGYWKRLGELALIRKRWELDRALDASTGQKMPARINPRDDGADGPVLTPHGSASRTHKWLRFTAGKAHVTVWWSHGWGKILGYHADGLVIGTYKRDVIGLTPAGEKKVYREAEDWLRRTLGPAKKTTPKKGPASKPPVAQRQVGRRVPARPMPPPPVPVPLTVRRRQAQP